MRLTGRTERGAAVIEMAIALPLLVLMVLGIIESVDNPSIDIADVVVDCPFPNTVRVRIQHDMNLLTPVLGGGVTTLDAESIGGKLSSAPCVASP